MAWSCHGHDNGDMVDKLAEAGMLKTKALQDAMKAVDRALFVPQRQRAYVDSPQTIGYGATISAPHMHASCLELLSQQLKPGAKVLDVGSGSGYLTLVFAHVACSGSREGRVVGIEHMPELVQASRAAAARVPWAADMIREGRVQLLQGDGYAGYPAGGPYDAIHVGAAASEIPAALTSSLAPGGRLVIPVGPEHGPQELVVVDKGPGDGQLVQLQQFGVMYVPLTTQQHQLHRAKMQEV